MVKVLDVHRLLLTLHTEKLIYCGSANCKQQKKKIELLLFILRTYKIRSNYLFKICTINYQKPNECIQNILFYAYVNSPYIL